jgi:hypothetical protein
MADHTAQPPTNGTGDPCCLSASVAFGEGPPRTGASIHVPPDCALVSFQRPPCPPDCPAGWRVWHMRRPSTCSSRRGAGRGWSKVFRGDVSHEQENACANGLCTTDEKHRGRDKPVQPAWVARNCNVSDTDIPDDTIARLGTASNALPSLAFARPENHSRLVCGRVRVVFDMFCRSPAKRLIYDTLLNFDKTMFMRRNHKMSAPL